tara:strand:+ start:2422 stop:3405 length:984 start_codon:yes stop_codon:yes gene_type:complete
MKILITGGYGFLGYHLAKKLSEKNNRITILDMKSEEHFDADFKDLLTNSRISYINTDLLDNQFSNSLEKDFSHIIHLAALLGVQNVLDNPLSVLQKNVNMLNNIISFINSLNKKPTLLFTSTSEIYAGTLLAGQLSFPTPEDSYLVLPNLELPRTSYMLSKIYGESLCHAANIKSIILRPHNLYGPRMGMKHVIPQLIKKIYNTPKNGTLGIFSPSHKRTFCYINDATYQILKLIHIENIESKTFNLGTEKPEIQMKELAYKLLKIMNRMDITLKHLENTPGSPERRCPSTSKLDNVTSLEERTKLEIGLKSTYNWYLKNKCTYLDN